MSTRPRGLLPSYRYIPKPEKEDGRYRFATFQNPDCGYPRSLFPDSYCAQAGSSEGASRGVVKRDRLAVAAHGCNTHTQRAAVQAARDPLPRAGITGPLMSAP